MTLWLANAATTLGRDHAVLRRNRQDAAGSWASENATFGIVSDGCGEGGASEVGALLTVALARAALLRGLEAGDDLGLIAEHAATAVERGLGVLAAAITADERERFVHEHLLATMVGFVARGREAVMFAAGDGVWLADESTRVLEQENRPHYLAYGIVGARAPLAIDSIRDASRLAVATDGLDPVALRSLSDSPPRSLARHLVLLQRNGGLSDDGAIAIAVRRTPCAS